METIVLNLADGTEQVFKGISSLDALVSAFLIGEGFSLSLSNELTRSNASKRIIFGKISAGLGDFAVKL